MKIRPVKLVYFSPTQTTKKIVEAIAQGARRQAASNISI